MKTIFITIFQGVEAKNLLRTNVYRTLLADPEVRLVLFVRSEERKQYYAAEFPDPRVTFAVMQYRLAGFWNTLFSKLKFTLLRTDTTDLRRRMKLDRDRNYFSFAGSWLANRILAHAWIRRIVRRLDGWLVHDRAFAPFFEKYRPAAVLCAHLFDDDETALLREAKRRCVPTVGFINSWDKMTARSTLRLLPDTLLVFNDIVAEEAIRHADMSANRITAVGLPQYDCYVGHHPTERSEFLKKAGLLPEDRILLYAPMGETFSTADWDIIDLLHGWELAGLLPGRLKPFVRFQPNDTVNDAELERRPWLRYDRPGKRFTRTRGVDWDMDDAELRHLADTLAHLDLLVCYASSISIDAAVFDKPVINVDFELRPHEMLAKSPTQFYRMTHYRNALATGGIRLARSKEDLLDAIRVYAADPRRDRDGRERLVREQCGIMDGKAGERLATALLRAIKKLRK